MSWAGKARPSSNYTDKPRPKTGGEGRFGFGVFGKARFGISDAWTRKTRPTGSWADKARP